MVPGGSRATCAFWSLKCTASAAGTPAQRLMFELRAQDSFQGVFAAAAAKSLQSCLTLCDPVDGSPPGSSIPGILQARTLEWVASAFSRGVFSSPQ